MESDIHALTHWPYQPIIGTQSCPIFSFLFLSFFFLPMNLNHDQDYYYSEKMNEPKKLNTNPFTCHVILLDICLKFMLVPRFLWKWSTFFIPEGTWFDSCFSCCALLAWFSFFRSVLIGFRGWAAFHSITCVCDENMSRCTWSLSNLRRKGNPISTFLWNLLRVSSFSWIKQERIPEFFVLSLLFVLLF